MAHISCPDCGAPNPPDAIACGECNHPLDVPDVGASSAPARARSGGPPPAQRPPRRERREPGEAGERPAPTVATWGYRPPRRGGSDVPGWVWGAIGLTALAAVLFAAVQIARQPAPLAIPNASKPQLASAESLRTLLRRDSTAVSPNVAMGNLMYDTENYSEAIPYYARALRSDPGQVDVRVDMAVAYHYTGNTEEARRILEDIVQQRPDHAIAYFDLGIIYQQTGRTEEARAAFLKARELPGPEGMQHVVDEMLARLDGRGTRGGAAGAGGASGLPPDHPPIDGASPGTPSGLPPDHPPIGGSPRRRRRVRGGRGRPSALARVSRSASASRSAASSTSRQG